GMAVLFLAYAPVARASWFYLVEGAGTHTASDTLSTSRPVSSLTSCQAAAATATGLVQDCVTTCDPANPSSAWFLEQLTPKGSFHGMGPYGFESDCEAGIADAVAAGMTNVMSACTLVTAKHFSGCK
ncbi:MAG TPA: hypothetical protein VGR40_06740, partial [Candidatus Binatus sp.]|nr:hypothetical protein [Candidatus Binatus sp.]